MAGSSGRCGTRWDVNLVRRGPHGWLLTEATLPEDPIDLPAVGVRITLADLYEKVEFLAKAAGMRPLQH